MNLNCELCKLSASRNNVVLGRGSKKAKVVFIGEAPGKHEDESGYAFTGRSGKLHDRMMERAGYKDGDYYITNVVRCRPPSNRDPEYEEIDSCLDYLYEELDEINSKVIVLLGRIAQVAYLQNLYTKDTSLFSQRIDDEEYGVTVFCAYHPAYILRYPEYEEQQINIYKRALFYVENGYDLRDRVADDSEELPENREDLKSIDLFDANNVSDRVINAWSRNNTIYLLKKTLEGNKVISKKFEHYVLMRKRDYNAAIRMEKDCFKKYIKRGLVTKIVSRENSKWVRFYVDLNGYDSKAFRHESKEYIPNPSMILYNTISADLGINIYEADIDPPFRYLIDNNIGYYSFDDYKILFMDFETDDTGGLRVGEMRIISVAWSDLSGEEEGFDYIDSNTDIEERNLLKRFKEVADKYDIMLAWNGDQFDFVELIERSELHGIYWDTKKIMFMDHMLIFEQFYQKSEGKITSIALDNVAKVVLGEDRGKINIGYSCTSCKKESLEPGLCECGAYKRKKKMMELYSEWMSEKNDMLMEYNLEDVRLMRDIEKSTGLIEVLVTMNYFSGVQADIRNPSPKIDSLMLRTGFLNDVYFKTKISTIGKEKYIGAYVLPTVAGLHDAVAVLDFASMYPSIYRTFNVCPTTMLRDWEISDEKDIIHTPMGICTTPKCTYVTAEWKYGDVCPKCKSEMFCHDVKFKKNVEGFVPNISKWTAEERNRFRELQFKYDVNDKEYMNYERMSYAMKQLGLCFYGDLGNPYSRYYYPELAGSITKIARFVIFKTLEWTEELGYKSILCDTDSDYVVPKTRPTDFDSIEEFSDAVNLEMCEVLKKYSGYMSDVLSVFNAKENYIRLEFETIYAPMLICEAKKRYAGKTIWRKGKITDKIDIKGLEAIRTDQLLIAQIMQRQVIDNILNKVPLKDTVDYIEKMREEIIFRRLSTDMVVISKGVSKEIEEYYGYVKDSETGKIKIKKDGTRQKKAIPVHIVVAEWIIEQKREFYVGMKVPYVIISSVKNNKPSKLVGIHIDDYYPAEFENIDDVLMYECEALADNFFGFDLDNYYGGYDPMYYWDRATFPCLERVLEIAYPNVDWKKYYLKNEMKIRSLEKKYIHRVNVIKRKSALDTLEDKVIKDDKLNRKAVDNILEEINKKRVELEK